MSAPTETRLDKAAAQLGGLVERHARPLRAGFGRYAVDPVGFLTGELGCVLWERQREIGALVRHSPRVVVRGAHGMGKDYLGTRLGLWFVYAVGGLVVCMAPTDRQLEIVMAEVRAAFRAAPDLPGELFSRALKIDGDVRLAAFTSTTTDALTGWHHPRGVMVLISEGQGEAVEATAYDAAFALTSEPGSRILVVGNPIRASGRFYEISRKANWKAVALSAFDHPNVKAGRRVVPWGPAPDWPQTIADEYGAGSDYYRSRVLAEFPSQDEDALIRAETLDAAADLERAERFAAEVERPGMAGPPAVVAVDVAREGEDRTAVAVRRGPLLWQLDRWREPDTVENARRVGGLVRRLIEQGVPVGHVVVDEVAVGGGVYDQLRRELRDVRYHVAEISGSYPRLWEVTPTLLGFKSSRRAELPERFADTRAQAFWHLRDELERGRFAFHARLDVELLVLLRAELRAHSYAYQGDDRIRVGAKDEVRARLGRSPDLADALAMSYAPELESGVKRKVAKSW